MQELVYQVIDKGLWGSKLDYQQTESENWAYEADLFKTVFEYFGRLSFCDDDGSTTYTYKLVLTSEDMDANLSWNRCYGLFTVREKKVKKTKNARKESFTYRYYVDSSLGKAEPEALERIARAEILETIPTDAKSLKGPLLHIKTFLSEIVEHERRKNLSA